MDDLDLSGNGAAYHRISIASDEDDLRRQQTGTANFEERHAVKIAARHVYEDRDWKRDEADIRPEFQRMIKDAERGVIKWIIVDQPNRFGTKNMKQRLKYFIRLDDAGCRLYTHAGKRLHIDDLVGLIETGIDAKASEEELKEKAHAVIGGKVGRAKTGEWMGGYIPFGMAIACLNLNKREVWRVEIVGRDKRLKVSADGTRTRYDGEDNFPAADPHQRLELRPTSYKDTLGVVRRIFDWYTTEAINLSAIARRLNAEGITTAYGIAWRSSHVQNVLQNPIYTGRMPYNRHSEAKYVEWTGGANGKQKVVAAADFGKWRKRHESEWILSPELFTPVVSPKQFEAAKKRMKAEGITKAPRSGEMWLSGLLFCAHCGAPLRANRAARSRKKGGESVSRSYVCATYSAAAVDDRKKATACGRHVVSHEQAEAHVRRYLADCGVYLREFGEKHDGPINIAREPFDRYIKAVGDMRRRVGLPEEGGDGVTEEQLAAIYRRKFEAEAPGIRARLDQLEAEHRDMVKGIMRLPDTATLAIKQVQEEIGDLESQIADLTTKLDNADDRALEAMNEIVAQFKAWQEATTAITEDISGRKKRDAVEAVIGAMVWTFKENPGRKKNRFEPVSVDVRPKGQEVSNRNPADALRYYYINTRPTRAGVRVY